MYLKRLEIQGFKSFAEKHSLEFGRGVSAVVGPNGSGKSNISDAVRWALGEQSAKSLRGSKMEDIIFAGTENRRPLNFAEVSLVIDNADRLLGEDYGEITITRRAFRMGESRFFINKTPVRLKDIHEIFFDTGIGREGYSIIGQGKIDEILSARSEDRRNLFEEAAGIIKYKTKRAEAEGKLAREAQNLVRADDILAGLEAQLEPLRRQAEKARRFFALSNRLKLVDVNIFVRRVADVQKEISGYDEALSGLKTSLENEQAAKDENEKKLEGLALSIEAADGEISAKNRELQEIRLAAERNAGAIDLAGQTIAFHESDIERLESDALSRLGETERARGEKRGLEEGLKALESEERAAAALCRDKQAELEIFAKELAEAEEKLEYYTRNHMDGLKREGDINAEISALEALYESFEQREEEISEEKAETFEKLAEARESIAALELRIEGNLKNARVIEDKTAAALAEKERVSAESEGIQAELTQNRAELNDAAVKKAFLAELAAGYEGYAKSVKAILREKDKGNALFSGIYGSVADLVSVPAKHRAAIEAALGAALQNLAVETEEQAKAAIEFLKKHNLGRATFLPLSAAGEGKRFNDAGIRLEKGFVGMAAELVEFDEKFSGIINNLLGHVVVMDNIDDAIAFSRKHKYRHKTVTLGGELFSPGGSLAGGSAGKGAGILSRAREIQDLSDRLSGLERERERLLAAQSEVSLKLSAITELIGKNRFRLHELETERIAAERDLAVLRGAAGALEKESQAQAAEEAALMEKISGANKSLRLLRQSHGEASAGIADILRNIEEQKADIKEKKKRLDAKNREQTALKIGLSALEGQKASALRDIGRAGAEERNLEESAKEIREKIRGKGLEIEEKRGEISGLKTEGEGLGRKLAEAEGRIPELNAARERLRADESELRALGETGGEIIARLGNEITRNEMKKERVDSDIKELYNDMWDRYNLTYRQAASAEYERLETGLAGLLAEGARLKAEIRELGPVNVSAVEEYEEVSERQAFMRKQRDDIAEAETKLRGIIGDLTALMEKQFSEKFSDISESFSRVFAEVFQGGRAYLKLQDGGNPLDSGIDIIAQPPGKNLQNMLLFSGGERALIAIALLFAILRLKPSPFCVLDEIESALDDANVARFAKFLKGYAEKTQFILITHRKGTMEIADRLYGVTMQELGISKLVSVKLENREQTED